MDSDLSDSNIQLRILSELSKIISLSSFEELLSVVTVTVPRLINATDCWIYLRPESMPDFPDELLDDNLQVVKSEEITSDYVVLVSIARPDSKFLVGKAFYPAGVGLTGWVFTHGIPLRLDDATNRAELEAIDPNLRWTDRYHGSEHHYSSHEKKPVLIVPLISPRGTIGVVTFPATIDHKPFTQSAQDAAIIVAQIIASTLDKTIVIRDQQEHIRQLVNIASKRDPEEVFRLVTKRLETMVGSRNCHLFLGENGGSIVRLVAESGHSIDPSIARTYRRGEDLIGWIFKTGKPLLISDVQDFARPTHLSDGLLEQISDNTVIDEEDRTLQCTRPCNEIKSVNPIPFMAVPVKAEDGDVLGVLCVGCANEMAGREMKSFSREALHLAESFAGIIAVALANNAERQLGDLLIELSYHSGLAKLYQLAIERVPLLLVGTGCSIFISERSNGHDLHLVKSSREGLASGSEVTELTYAIGEGKTGTCALTRATLVVNHYGTGKAAELAMDSEMRRVTDQHHNDLIDDLLDEQGTRVGLVQLRRGRLTSARAQTEFHRLATRLTVQLKSGLPSPKAKIMLALGSRPSWSFVAVPIKSESDDLFGVVTVGRPVPKSPFSNVDVTLLESIANRLGAVLQNLQLQEQRILLLVGLAHEINTPLQAVIADTENLMLELPLDSELLDLAKHSLDQVLQLHLQTETFMTVLSEQKPPERLFTMHSIFRPLKEAIEMFKGEAEAKGCNILDPIPDPSDDQFPVIEMSLFDLTIAFKNLIHNAVKYSFQPLRGQKGSRFVRIRGHWVDKAHRYYSVRIQNLGVGIPQEEIDSGLIFRPFTRGAKASDRRRTGAGLGLAHVRQIVEDLHHGKVEVTSRLLSGEAYLTTFTVILPVHQFD